LREDELTETTPPVPTRLLRRPEVESRVGLTCSTIYELMAAGEFPRPVPINGRTVGWVESEIEVWVVGRIAAARDTNQ